MCEGVGVYISAPQCVRDQVSTDLSLPCRVFQPQIHLEDFTLTRHAIKCVDCDLFQLEWLPCSGQSITFEAYGAFFCL